MVPRLEGLVEALDHGLPALRRSMAESRAEAITARQLVCVYVLVFSNHVFLIFCACPAFLPAIVTIKVAGNTYVQLLHRCCKFCKMLLCLYPSSNSWCVLLSWRSFFPMFRHHPIFFCRRSRPTGDVWDTVKCCAHLNCVSRKIYAWIMDHGSWMFETQ